MAHTKINYVLVLLFALSVISCKKMSKEYTTVEITVINPADGTPFVDVPVKLLEEESKNSGITSELFMEDKTNSNGIVKFEFKAAKTSKYWYTPVIDEDYFGEYSTWEYLKRPSPSSYIIKKDQDNLIEYEITYYGFLNTKIQNVNCLGATDTLTYHKRYLNLPKGYGSASYDYSNTRTGCVDLFLTPNNQNSGNVFQGWHKVNWEAKKGDILTTGMDSVYVGKGETGTLEIIY